MIIHKNKIDWMRKALPQTLGTKSYDPYYIEIKLHKHEWENVTELIQKEQEKMQKIKANEQNLIFTLCDDQILRIRTDICYWPKQITETWKNFKYTVAEDYRIPISDLIKN